MNSYSKNWKNRQKSLNAIIEKLETVNDMKKSSIYLEYSMPIICNGLRDHLLAVCKYYYSPSFASVFNHKTKTRDFRVL